MTGNIIQVKNNVVYDAIKASNSEATEVVTRWMHEQHPDIPAEVVADIEGAAEQGLWFVKHPDGNVMLVPREDFVKDFTEVDIAAIFAAELESAPAAPVAEKVEERVEAQAQIDAFIAQRVGTMLNEFEDLLGMYSDEEDSTGVEGVEAALSRFKDVFGVKDK